MGRPGDGGDRGRCVKGLTLCSRDGGCGCGYATSCRSVREVDVCALYEFVFGLMSVSGPGPGPGEGVLITGCGAAVHIVVAAPETATLVVLSDDALC